MSKEFESLTKYIEIFEADEFGTWIVDRGHRGTREDPIQMPYVSYSESVNDFVDAIYNFMDTHKEYNLNRYEEILVKNGLEWGTRSMEEADVSKLDDKCVMALLMGIVRADRFCEGIILDFLKEGIILKWLKRLAEFDQ